MNLREEQEAMRARQQQRSTKKTAEKINRLCAQVEQAEQRLADKRAESSERGKS